MAVQLLTSGHRQSFEFLQEVVSIDRSQYQGVLVDDIDSLTCLQTFFTKAENFFRDGRFAQVSQAYCEAAKCPTFKSKFWLQELIMERALEAAQRYKADGGRQLAYCQLQLSQMLENAKVRKLRNKNMIHGSDYVVEPPARCIALLEQCLQASLGRSQWLVDLIPYEFICSGHLARAKLASGLCDEENLKEVIKLAEQANCVWLECLSNYYLGALLYEAEGREMEATVRLERGLDVLQKSKGSDKKSVINDQVWSDKETCMQAPSLDRLAGMCTVKLAKLKLRMKDESNADKAAELLQSYLESWPEVNNEKSEAYLLLGEINDRNFNRPEQAVESYDRAFKVDQGRSCSTRVSLGIANSHLLLDGIMNLLNNSNVNTSSSGKGTSKRLLVWKDQPDDYEHDLDSE